ncbi:MAG: hypothetical protein JW755_00780 [Candidatus Aminicenantes bacterium]|nr:hypothetical protein [Candidatus Aminicenantes bacterium]
MTAMRRQPRLIFLVKLLLIPALCSLSLPPKTYPQNSSQKQQDQNTQWIFFSHDKTNFPLTGRHRIVPCAECHINSVFKGTPTSCEACHWDRQQDDRFRLRLGTHCEQCHTTLSWKNIPPGKWDHGIDAGYPLHGAHKTLDCMDCHSQDNFWLNRVHCYQCHENDYLSVKDPDHQAAGFPLDCQICHRNETSWQNAQFNHSLFPLQGSHRIVRCSECHQNGNYQGLPIDCYSCHAEDYNRAKNPDHIALNFPTLCEMCHSPNAYTWQEANFLHTKFPLKGKHKTALCSDCHKNDLYTGLPSVCVYCHLDDYLNASDPNHKQLGFHTDCQECHGTEAVSWKKTTYQAFYFHRFPLKESRHAILSCSDCHHSKDYHIYTCLDCHAHEKHRMDRAHSDLAGYIYESQACLGCHYHGKK